MTHGNNYNIKCPYCDKINNYIITNISHMQLGRYYTLKKLCQYCKRMVHYTYRYEIAIVAEKLEEYVI